ncbi:hypothetical protein GPALN_012186 [Globodera pallida]|nr:hypothetical protein GPALN_012186 [Globodera pallida]
MAPLPTLFALLCSVAVLLVLCDGKIFTDANDNDLYKERQRPAKTVEAKYHQREEALANQHQNEREEWERKMVETKRKFEMERQKFEQKMRLKRQEQTEQLAQIANERKRQDEQQQQR